MPQSFLAFLRSNKSDGKTDHQMRAPLMQGYQSNRFFNGGRRIANGDDKIVAKTHPCPPDTCGRTAQSRGFGEDLRLLIMNKATSRDTQTIQESSPQAALHHCYVGYDWHTARQSRHPGSDGPGRNEYIINHTKIATGMNETLQ
jgi:hypothetical protein